MTSSLEDLPSSVDAPAFSVVVPTVGRASLRDLLRALDEAGGPRPREVVVVDDRRASSLLDVSVAGDLPVKVARSGGRGPAGARNTGWRVLAPVEWVAFLDDDVLPPPDWTARLAADLAGCAPDVAGSQGRIVVPLPTDRPPTDWERVTAGLSRARWATADMAYRLDALRAVGGFDERFPRAYREDADLALRVRQAGWRLVLGSRHVTHPVRAAGPWVSLRAQAGNADDVLMRRLHGPRWRELADVPRGRRPRHFAVVVAAVAAAALAASGHRSAALLPMIAWAGGTAELAWARIAPGPHTADEVTRMVATSVPMPFVAAGWWLAGQSRWRAVRRSQVDARSRPRGAGGQPRLAAVLFDRDGTLVRDVPYNGAPELVRPVPGAAEAVARVRRAGLRTGVITNQSGIARGLLSRAQVDAVNARVDDLLGPFDTWQVCPHSDEDGCECRKPRPGMVLAAARDLDVEPAEVAVVGDIGADLAAAAAAGARGVLVPTPATLAHEVTAAREVSGTVVAGTIEEAVEVLLRTCVVAGAR